MTKVPSTRLSIRRTTVRLLDQVRLGGIGGAGRPYYKSGNTCDANCSFEGTSTCSEGCDR